MSHSPIQEDIHKFQEDFHILKPYLMITLLFTLCCLAIIILFSDARDKEIQENNRVHAAYQAEEQARATMMSKYRPGQNVYIGDAMTPATFLSITPVPFNNSYEVEVLFNGKRMSIPESALRQPNTISTGR